MKKLILYFAFATCVAFAPSCEKEDDTAIKVYYASQPGYGGGTNPNPNGLPNTSGGTSTGSGTTTPTCTNAMTVNGATCASVSAAGGVVSGTYKLVHSGSCIQVQITFPIGAPPGSGSYQVVASGPVGNQCTFIDATNGINATGGSVSVTAGSTNKITYSNIVAGALTCTGTACY